MAHASVRSVSKRRPRVSQGRVTRRYKTGFWYKRRPIRPRWLHSCCAGVAEQTTTGQTASWSIVITIPLLFMYLRDARRIHIKRYAWRTKTRAYTCIRACIYWYYPLRYFLYVYENISRIGINLLNLIFHCTQTIPRNVITYPYIFLP